jgi:hemerythrin-like domain-containing protein
VRLFLNYAAWIEAVDDNSSMLRDPSLIPLSHQHQRALSLCVRLDRALQAGSLDLDFWRLEVQQHFTNEIRVHFAAEEQVLFPAARGFTELAPLVEELTGEHRQLREHFVHAEQSTMDRAELKEFAELLSGHVRKEERQLFEGMQSVMSPEELRVVGEELAHALEESVQVCRLGSREEGSESR